MPGRLGNMTYINILTFCILPLHEVAVSCIMVPNKKTHPAFHWGMISKWEISLEHRGKSVFPFSWYQPILGEKGNTATSSNDLVILKIPSNSRRVTVHDWNSSIIFQWMGKGLSATIGGESLASPKSFWSQCWGYVANPPWLTQKD